MKQWIDIKQDPPTRCGNIYVKLSDGKTVITHAAVAAVGKHKISDGFLYRLRNSGEFTLLADDDIIVCYVYYTHDASEPDSVYVKADGIVSYFYY
jgi:hypothetical protein